MNNKKLNIGKKFMYVGIFIAYTALTFVLTKCTAITKDEMKLISEDIEAIAEITENI